MLHPVHEDYTKKFFEGIPEKLKTVEAIPLILVGYGVGEGHHAKGAYVLLNCQDKSEMEMLTLLKHVVERLEKSLQ